VKSALAAGSPPTGPRTGGVGRAAHSSERVAAGLDAAVGDRERLDERAPAAAPLGPSRSDGAVDAVDRGDRGSDALRIGGTLDEDLVRQQRALADARLLERDQGRLGVARLRDRVGVVVAELDLRRGEREGGDDG
jgi:hypothetical protein